MNAANLRDKDSAVEPVLYIAMELSNKQWKLVLADGVKRQRVTIEAGDLAQLGVAITKAGVGRPPGVGRAGVGRGDRRQRPAWIPGTDIWVPE